MTMHPPKPATHYTTARMLTVVVLPLAIYVLQLLGKVFGLALFAAGVLVCLKVFIEIVNTSRPTPALRAVHPPHTAPSTQCHYCHTRRGPFRFHPDPTHRLPVGTKVCNHCYFTRLLTAEYMSTHFEPL